MGTPIEGGGTMAAASLSEAIKEAKDITKKSSSESKKAGI